MPHGSSVKTMEETERMRSEDKIALSMLAGGILALAIALGVSRFAYTPLMPLMQQQARFADDFAGLLASANYAGYLIGALWAAWTSKSTGRAGRLRIHLILTITTVLGMGLSDHTGVWFALRFFSGFTSALVFVLASGIVLEALAFYRRAAWSGWLYSGVGGGIALSAVLIPPLNDIGGWQGGWLGLALISMALMPGIWMLLPERSFSMAQRTDKKLEPPSHSRLLPWLTIAYGLEGLGYIVTGTFLVAWLQRLPDLAQYSFLAWFMVGLAAAPSCVLWITIGVRWGLVKTLIIAHIVQAVGILLPTISPSLSGGLAGAVFFGGTFLGIAALSLVLGRTLAPERADRVIAVLTASFGAGQMLGPTMAGFIAVKAQSLSLPLIGAASTVALGAVSLLLGLICTKGADARPQIERT